VSTEHNKDEEAIYYEAIGKGPDEREAYLKVVCGPDAALLARIRKLLKAQEVRDNFLESAPWAPEILPDTSAVMEEPGAVIGRYKLL